MCTLRSCSSSDNEYLEEHLDGVGVFLYNGSFGHVSVYMRDSDTLLECPSVTRFLKN